MRRATRNLFSYLAVLLGQIALHRKRPTCKVISNPMLFPGNRYYLALNFLLVVFIFLGCGNLKAEEKITIGPVEEVVLLPWGIKLLARIDTGANTSSLGARDLKINGNSAEFNIRPEYGGANMKLPIIEWRGFRAGGSHEIRPVVELEFCLGSKRIRTQVNLNDRSTVSYPFLIGRRVLRGNFVVDVSRSQRITPSCPGVNSK